mmetsp:Transcript_20981/g.70447  ORF Transcript_20981/g.70447 Transcript_20981/m.70447 type:complete len:282 (+) Transcript_20981:171-1016(+)
MLVSTDRMAACSCAAKSIWLSGTPCAQKMSPRSLRPTARRLRWGASTLASTSTLSHTRESVVSISSTETRQADSSMSAIAPVRSISAAMAAEALSSPAASSPSTAFSMLRNTLYVLTPAVAALSAELAWCPRARSLCSWAVRPPMAPSPRYWSALAAYACPMVCSSTSPKEALARRSARAAASAANSASSPATNCASRSASATAQRTSRRRWRPARRAWESSPGSMEKSMASWSSPMSASNCSDPKRMAKKVVVSRNFCWRSASRPSRSYRARSSSLESTW